MPASFPSSTTRTCGRCSNASTMGFSARPSCCPCSSSVTAGGLWLASLAHRRSSPMLGVLICAATCLLVSPISWVHHMVWVVPAILWLALADDRPRLGPRPGCWRRRSVLERAHLVGAVQEHVGSPPQRLAAPRGELVLLRDRDLHLRRSRSGRPTTGQRVGPGSSTRLITVCQRTRASAVARPSRWRFTALSTLLTAQSAP